MDESATDIAVVTSAEAVNRPHIDWGAVIGGAFLAVATSFVLLSFGSAIGLTLTSPYAGEGLSLWGFAVAAALWLVWVQVSSFMARRIPDRSHAPPRFRRDRHTRATCEMARTVCWCGPSALCLVHS